jgi:4-alpha-glucanotransferase
MLTSDSSFTPSETYEQSLTRAAGLFGIESEYWDIWGKHHTASAEGMAAVLGSMGVDAGSRETLDQAVEQRLWEQWSRLLPPTIVTGTAQPAATVCLPSDEPGPIRMSVVWEDGSSDDAPAPISGIRPSRRVRLRDRDFSAYDIRLPFGARLGYHELRVSVPSGHEAAARLIVCPERAYFPPRLAENGRTGGIFVSLYGLRSERNWGCGDFTDLKALTEWVAQDLNASFIGLNPLHAIANRQPYNTSPYLPTVRVLQEPDLSRCRSH